MLKIIFLIALIVLFLANFYYTYATNKRINRSKLVVKKLKQELKRTQNTLFDFSDQMSINKAKIESRLEELESGKKTSAKKKTTTKKTTAKKTTTKKASK